MENYNSLDLGTEWDLVTSKQWKQKIQFELNGADYNDTLIWNAPEDIQVKPFYHKDETTSGFNVKTKSGEFKICQNIFVHDTDKSIFRANESISRGAESLCFTIEDENIDVEKLLNSINFENNSVYLNLNFLSIDFVKRLIKIVKEKSVQIYCNLDPIGHLANEGNWYKTIEKTNYNR